MAALLQVAVLNAYARLAQSCEASAKVIMEWCPWSGLSVFVSALELPPQIAQVVYEIAYGVRHELVKMLPTAIIFPEASLKRA